jgi:hypothetical protein
MEKWKDIKGYEGKYQVSNLGNVKSLQRFANHWQGGIRIVPEKILKQFIKQGYYYVDLGNKKQYRVNRLVACEFLINTYNKAEVNHNDGNKLNNHATNLEWATRSENMKHCYKTGLWNNQHTINKSGTKTK